MNEFNFRDFLNYIILLKQNINWVNFLDLFFVVLIIFFFLYFFKKIHVHRVVLGFLISFSLIYFLSFWLKFYTVLSIVNFLLGFLLIIFVILFQKELRRFIHILDIKYLKKEISKKRNSFYLKDDFLKKLTETVFELAKNK
ncbi:MAG: hypothetical protein N2692_03165, partial [Patescibacteria group bacterium]|nr:hypothetical protein [Patescibacteria group bacterium]